MSVQTQYGARRHAAWRSHFWPWCTSDTVVGAVLGLVVASNAAVIVWLWLHDGNLAQVHSAGDFLTSTGRIAGLMTAYLALIQVLMLARLPFLERLVGFDRLTIWHRRNGKIVFGLLLTHVTSIVTGYSLNAHTSIPAEIWVLLTSYPGIVAAVAGGSLLVVVVASSIVIVKRRLPYEAWYAVHLSAYAGITLAWFHQIPNGNEFVLNPAAATYWKSLYAVSLTLLILGRVLQPLVRAFRFRLRVDRVVAEGPGAVSVYITGKRLDRMGARAGQFFLFRFLSGGRWWQAHPFSLSAAPDGHSLRITAKALGSFTKHLGELNPGTAVVVEGPFGRFTEEARRHERVALIAGGIGITPIRALVEEMSGDVVVIYRAHDEAELIFRDELDRLAAERGIRVLYVVGGHSSPVNRHLLSPAHLRELLPDIADRDVYVCGPPSLARMIEGNLRQAGVPQQQIHSERFAL